MKVLLLVVAAAVVLHCVIGVHAALLFTDEVQRMPEETDDDYWNRIQSSGQPLVRDGRSASSIPYHLRQASFLKEHTFLPTVWGRDLNAYIAGRDDVQRLDVAQPGIERTRASRTVDGLYYTPFDADTEYVHVGTHGTHVEYNTANRDLAPEVKLSSIAREGLRSGDNGKHYPNIYGPGAYTTGRSALAATGGCFYFCLNSKDPAFDHDQHGVVNLELFLPVSILRQLNVAVVPAIRDGPKPFTEAKWRDFFTEHDGQLKRTREEMELSENDVVAAMHPDYELPDEATWDQQIMRHARFIGEVVDKKVMHSRCMLRKHFKPLWSNSDIGKKTSWLNFIIPWTERNIPETPAFKAFRHVMFPINHLTPIAPASPFLADYLTPETMGAIVRDY